MHIAKDKTPQHLAPQDVNTTAGVHEHQHGEVGADPSFIGKIWQLVQIEEQESML